MAKLLLLFIVLATIASANAVVIRSVMRRDPTVDLVAAINDESNFCSFLPPRPGITIGASEGDATAFCTQAGLTPNAQQYPQGFIVSSHFKSTDTYVQITGTINDDAFGLPADDGGGQYDNANGGSPPGASCQGYNYFVNLVEPDVGLFCIRCCMNSDDCDTGHSTYGCKRVIPGIY